MIKIWFEDFWFGFDKSNNYFTQLLTEYKLEYTISNNNPDLLFFSIFGNNNYLYNYKKIFYTGENVNPLIYKADGYFSFDYINNENHFRLPLYLLYDSYYELVNKKIDENLINRKFCNFVFSNPKSKNRNNIFVKLSNYKKIDSGGKWLNNIGYFVESKIDFQKEYKFSIAYENECYRYETNGYTTEKIIEPMYSNSIPIYWGNPIVHKDFNTKSFINYYDFSSEKEMIDYIIYLDQNDDEYYKKLNNYWLYNNIIPTEFNRINIFNFIKKYIT
jgi:hypothetical protein